MLGLLGPAAWFLWRRGRWTDSERWVRQNVSPSAVTASPLAGLLVAFVGLMLIWPPAVLLAFLAGSGLVLLLASGTRTGPIRRAGSRSRQTSLF
jgi:hypothetical protein